MDVLLLHVPKFRNYYKPIGSFSFIQIPPIGLLALADYARQNRFTAEVVHLGVEREKYGKLNLGKLISELQPSIVGLDLYWHFQSFDAIEVAREIKRTHPAVKILLGGFTASYFAKEILEEFDCVDFVIRGDAEIPLVSLLQHQNDGAFDQVPNLAYRNPDSVQLNEMSYVADEAMLNELCYTNFKLMKDYSLFVESFSRQLSLDSFSLSAQRRLLGWKRSYPISLGRGCAHDCSYCGGGSEAQQIINNRHCVNVRSVKSVLSSISDLNYYGFEHASLTFDPFPGRTAEPFYFELFEGIRNLNTRMTFEVERYSLPTRAFLKKMRECLSKNSFLSLSLNTHDEELRRKNRMYRYSNKELEETLEMVDEEGVKCVLYFTSGLPFETSEHMNAMAEYQRHLRTSFSNVKLKNGIISLAPASPMSRHPEAFGIRQEKTTFKQYYEYHSLPDRNPFFAMGFDRAGCPSATEVSPFFCEHFCTHFTTGKLAPIACKAVCGASAFLQKIGAFRLLNRIASSKRPVLSAALQHVREGSDSAD